MEFLKSQKNLIKIIVGLMLFSFIVFLINENAGSFMVFLSWIIIGYSCYKYRKLNKVEKENGKEEREVVTMGKYKNFILKDNAKAYIPTESQTKEEIEIDEETSTELTEEIPYNITIKTKGFFEHIKTKKKTMSFEVAGTFKKNCQNRINRFFLNLFDLGKIKRYEGLSPKEMKKDYRGLEIYEMPQDYKITGNNINFIPEPKNEFDKNAIVVSLKDIGMVGYVPKNLNIQFKEIIKLKKIYDIYAKLSQKNFILL